MKGTTQRTDERRNKVYNVLKRFPNGVTFHMICKAMDISKDEQTDRLRVRDAVTNLVHNRHADYQGTLYYPVGV